MRISDWSSDVCSSDLAGLQRQLGSAEQQIGFDRLLGRIGVAGEIDAETVVLDPLLGITIAFAGRLIRRDADTCSKTRSAGQRGDLANSGMDAWHGCAPRPAYGQLRSAEERQSGVWGKSV